MNNKDRKPFNTHSVLDTGFDKSRRRFLKYTGASSVLVASSHSLASSSSLLENRVAVGRSLLPSTIRFNGERKDPVTGMYLLGNGYRAYNPSMARFNAPDSASPFGGGGINSYAYCLGDPVNRTDPSGHFALMSLLIGAIVGAVVGATVSIVSEGIQTAVNPDHDFDWKQVGIGATLGFISGGFGAAAKGAKASVKVGLAVADTVTSSAAEFGLNVATGMPVKQAGISAGVGAIVGLGSYGAGYGTKRFSNSTQSHPPMRSNTTHPMSIEGQPNYGPWPRGYTDNFRGTGEEAILLHGDPNGNVLVGEKAFLDPKTNQWDTDYNNASLLTGSQLARHMKNNEGIDLYKGSSPVHLLSCFAKRGAAQDLATEIRRPVIAYSKNPTWTHNLNSIESPTFSVGASFGKWDPRNCFWDRHGAKPRRFDP
ncbi:RHS repeat-associated core domain-containing protein [Vibrio campbellii]|uniref:RHS repeat-associated core domain-containing protein n=1 Tax=Vibrio campbellii TaxID=680 RepID=UPI000687895A|nr:RHS repeat-associated core domain-containing protein [Vibrio campbellii]